ncbi:MAG: hemagglutinin repeat-containing protein, partial [Acidiferrobacterales bacterium]
ASIGIDGKQRKTETDQTSLTHQGSTLNFGDTLNIRSKGATTVAASDVSTDGDLNINAKKGIAIVSADDVLTRAEKQSAANLRVSVGVGNAYNDIYQATEAFKKAQDQTRVAQRSLKAFEAELKQMQADLKTGKVTADDIRLRREDRKYYDANVALAVLNEVNAAIAIAQSGARAGAAASTSAGTGFYADVMLEMDGSTTNRTEESRRSAASRLVAGGDMSLNSGDDIHIKGSDIGANGNLTLVAKNDIQIEAGRESQSSTENRSSASFQKSWGTYGMSAGTGSWNVAGSTGFDRSDSTTWRNSVINAGDQLKFQSGNDTTLAGAQAQGRTVVANVGGNLTLESKQNTSNAAGQDAGLSIGSSRVGINGGSRNQRRRWTDDPTTLIGTESVSINVKENTQLTGALLAQINENGTDGGNLSLRTKSLTYKDLIDTDTSTDWSAGFSTGLRWKTPSKQDKEANKTKQGKTDTKPKQQESDQNNDSKKSDLPNTGTTSLQASFNGYVRGQSTRATLGQGNITFSADGEFIPEGLNRDIESSQVVTANRTTGGLNVDVTIDHRMFSKAGRNAIREDFKRTQILGETFLDLAQSGVSLFGDREEGRSSFNQHLKQNIGYFEATKTFASNDANLKHISALTSGNATPEQKAAAYTALANTIAAELGISPSQAKLLVQDNFNLKTRNGKQLKGAFSKQANAIFIVDDNNRTTGDAVN